MLKLRKTVAINAPVSEVFAYLSEPENLLEIWPSMQEIKNVKAEKNGGYEFDWVYKMAGVRFHGHSETVALEPNHLIVRKNERGIPSTFRWTFEDHGDTTVFTSEVDYEMPGGLLGKLAQPFVRGVNEREADLFDANLKARCEAAHAMAHPQA